MKRLTPQWYDTPVSEKEFNTIQSKLRYCLPNSYKKVPSMAHTNTMGLIEHEHGLKLRA